MLYKKYKAIKASVLVLLCLGLCSLHSFAQQTVYWQDENSEFKQALAQFEAEKYTLCYPTWVKLQQQVNNNSTELANQIKQDVAYYKTVCELILSKQDAENNALQFINQHAQSVWLNHIQYYLSEYYFKNEQYDKALASYKLVAHNNLNNQQIGALKFHKAYCLFLAKQFTEAGPLFNAIRQVKTNPYYIDANYYYAFISFYEKKYDDAKQCFLIAKDDENYKSVVPFYLVEIYYFKGQTDTALSLGIQELKQGNSLYTVQLQQLVGHILFEKGKFKDALPYLEKYVSKTAKVRREDLYQLSYCYYAAETWTKCIEGFKQLGGKEDSLAQNSMYLLADAYLKLGDKDQAKTAFLFCAQNASNKKQQEVSVFSYAKLSYELKYYSDALRYIQLFLKQYQSSIFKQEAVELEVNILGNTSNYKEAISKIDSIKNPSENISKILPKVLYGRVCELINDEQFTEAQQFLNRIIKITNNNAYLSYAYFWKGELAYRNNNIDDAIQYLQAYLTSPKNSGEVNATHAYYILGYCFTKKENYKQAFEYFAKLVKYPTANSNTVEQDGWLRAADCHFMMRQYTQALVKYEIVIDQKWNTADYATYQKAIILGALNKYKEKIEYLQIVGTNFPHSSLVEDAYLEIANTYIANERYDDAIPYLNLLIKSNHNNSLLPQAYLKLGIAYFSLNKNAESLEVFKKLVNSYRETEESNEAIEYIRNLFIENHEPEAFISFMKTNGKPITVSEEDSLTFKSSLLRYEASEFEQAKLGFQKYLSTYPSGKYIIEANYFSAEISLQNKVLNEALTFYEAVVKLAPNKYAERSALQASRIAYFDIKNYAKAEQLYTQVKSLTHTDEVKWEAERGLLRSLYKQKKWKEAQPQTQYILSAKNASAEDKVIAYIINAEFNVADSNMDKAIENYKQIISLNKSDISAEAQYQIAYLLFVKGDLAQAETSAFDVIKKYGSYEQWVAKAYILLGDIYFKQKDYFNAEATFKSVAANTTIVALKQEAEEKLKQVIAEKNKNNQVEISQQ